MSWMLRIEHQSRYRYRDEVTASYNEARMTPLTTDRQMTVESRLEVEPRTRTYRYLDYWATVVDAFDVHRPHTGMTVQATSVVDSRTAVIRTEDWSTSLVLVTCYPFDAVRPGGPLRYVVTASASGE